MAHPERHVLGMLGQKGITLLQRHLDIKFVRQFDDGPCALRSQLRVCGDGVEVAEELLSLLQAAVGEGDCGWRGALAVTGKVGLQHPREDAGMGCQVG